MFRHSRFVFLSVSLMLVLLISLGRPMVVYADDSTPPPAATEELIEPPVEETPIAVESDVPSPETPASPGMEAEAVPPQAVEAEAGHSETVIPETVPVEEVPPEPVTVPELLEAAPEGTEIVVLDEDGSALPLASQDAAEVVATADPIWCPAGVLPGGSGCTTNFVSPQALIDDMDASNPGSADSIYEQDGIIYFTADPGGEFVLASGGGNLISSADYSALRSFNLTLQGGWNGLNDGAGFALNGQTDFGANRVQIGSVGSPWAGNITINNISINGASTTGLTVYTEGDINLNSVNSQNNTGMGARVDNDSGSGAITIQDSSFDNNTEHGLRVTSNGDITLTRVNARNNTRGGAQLDNTTGSGNINISFNNFIGNVEPGLEALSNGNITLSQVIASKNSDSGAYLENTTGSGSISISDSSFSSNGVDGLEAYSTGDITVDHITIDGNTENGGSFYTDLGEGNIFISKSTFNSNTSLGQDLGLEIISGGDVTLSEVSASNNVAGNGGYIVGSSLVIENSTFSDNASVDLASGLGLYAEAEEAEIICSQFSGNSAYGLDGSNVMLLTLDDVTFSGNDSGDYLGLPVITNGGCTPDDGGGDEGGGEEGGGEEGGEEGGEVEVQPSESDDSSQNVIPVTGLPLHIVPVTGAEKTGLDCNAYSGTKLILPNGDSIILPCPIQDEGSLVGYTEDQLPGQLDDEFTFLSALDAEVLRDSKLVSTLERNMTIDFIIPDGQLQATLVILHWDGSQWVEVPGYITDDGTFEATTLSTGIFVLVTK